MLRGGAFCDDVVINLVNRRFVPNYYDLAPPGNNFGDAWAYDEDAVKAIGKFKVRRGGSQDNDGRVVADDYPTAVFVTPDGKKLDADIKGIMPPAVLVEKLRKVMSDHADWFKPVPDAADPKEAARLAWELADWDRALKHIEAAGKDPEMTYLRARVLTCRGEHEKALEVAKAPPEDSPWWDDVETARGRALLNLERYDDALKAYEGVLEKAPKGNRVGEALYYAGLCHWGSGRKAEAKKLWRRHRAELPHDRLARRSAISLGLPEAEAFMNQELVDRKGWW